MSDDGPLAWDDAGKRAKFLTIVIFSVAMDLAFVVAYAILLVLSHLFFDWATSRWPEATKLAELLEWVFGVSTSLLVAGYVVADAWFHLSRIFGEAGETAD